MARRRLVVVMRRLAVLLVLALVAAACSGSDSDSDTTAATSPTTTTSSTSGNDATTTTSVDPGNGDATTTTAGATTGTTTGGGSIAEATFVISRVVFGDEAYVSITNIGSESGNLEGWQLCQRPAYFRIGSVEVAPGETVHFTDGSVDGLTGQVIDANGRFGKLSASSGEIGLYVDNSFGSASSIRSYVEWGSSDHGRSSVAVEAGIWAEGGFVAADGVPGLAAVVDAPTSPADWATS